MVDADGKPAAGAQVRMLPEFLNGSRWRKAATNGVFHLVYSLMPEQLQSGGSLLVAIDPVRNLADIEPLDEKTTNLDVMLQPALTITGLVRNEDGSPLAGAQVGVRIKAGETYSHLKEQTAASDAQGRYEIKCLPPDGAYLVSASATGCGNSEQKVQGVSETNRMELSPFVLKLADRVLAGQAPNSGPAAPSLQGTVTDADGKPAVGAQVAVFPSFRDSRWSRTSTNGAFSLAWTPRRTFGRGGGRPLASVLVVLDPARNLGAAAIVEVTTTNLDVKLKPALAMSGLVRNTDGSPVAGAKVSVQLETGPGSSPLNEQIFSSDAQGRYEIKGLPPGASYTVFASAKGHGQSRQHVPGIAETNRVSPSPLVLKLADHVLAGQVLNEKNKPVAGINVSVTSQDQPGGSVATDGQGRFHFQVCEGEVRLFAHNQPRGVAYATVAAGDTNVVMTLAPQSGVVLQAPARQPLNGHLLPASAGANFASGAVPDGQPVLLCLFDADQRSSRQIMRRLNEQAAALRQQGVTTLGLQAVVTSGEIFNEWKSESPVSFPLGRATEKSENINWVLSVPSLPWLILTDAKHRVVAEGFAPQDLDAEIKKLAK